MKGGFIPQFKWVLPQVVGSESFKELCRSLELRWKKGWRTARQNHVRRQKKNTNNETSWNKVKWQCGNCCSPLMSPGLGVRSFWKIGIYISWKCIFILSHSASMLHPHQASCQKTKIDVRCTGRYQGWLIWNRIQIKTWHI